MYNSGIIEVIGPAGSINSRLTNSTEDEDAGRLSVYDNRGEVAAQVSAFTNARGGFINTFGPMGSRNIRLSNNVGDSDAGNLSILDNRGEIAVSIGAFSNAEGGFLQTFGPNGEDNIILTTLSTNANHGFLAVRDVNGDNQAGLFVDANGEGVVFRDRESTLLNFPDRSDKVIVYAGIDGPAPAVYDRGTGKLIDGEIFIPFSDHFAAAISPNSLTINLTPLFADTYGLAVVEKTNEGFKVKELKNGKGDFSFDWEVKAVRKGYSKYKTVRSRAELKQFEKVNTPVARDGDKNN